MTECRVFNLYFIQELYGRKSLNMFLPLEDLLMTITGCLSLLFMYTWRLKLRYTIARVHESLMVYHFYALDDFC